MTPLWLDLGEPGRGWVRDSLAAGRMLSRHVLARLNLDEGSTIALGLVPGESNDLSDLKHGLPNESTCSMEASAEVLLALITQLNDTGDAQLLVVENDLARPDDPAVLNRAPGSVTFADETVFHLQDVADLKTGTG